MIDQEFFHYLGRRINQWRISRCPSASVGLLTDRPSSSFRPWSSGFGFAGQCFLSGAVSARRNHWDSFFIGVCWAMLIFRDENPAIIDCPAVST